MARIFFGLFFSRKKTIEEILENIQKKLPSLEKKMNQIYAMENKIEAMVLLFQTISPIQDSGGFIRENYELIKYSRPGKFLSQIHALLALEKYFNKAGRSKDGFNRTAKGEEITADKILLDCEYWQKPKTAAYCLSHKNDLQQKNQMNRLQCPLRPVSYVSEWDVVYNQCDLFITENAKGILKQINILKQFKSWGGY